MMTGLIAAVFFGLLSAGGHVATTSQSAASDPALRALIEQTDRESPGESYQQAITVDSLVLLANAVASLAQQKGILIPLADDVARLRANTRNYQAGLPEDDRQSARLRRTLIQANGLIQRLVAEANHERRPSDPSLHALRRAADSLDSDQPLRRQPDVIERFFAQAVAILQRVDHPQTRPREV